MEEKITAWVARDKFPYRVYIFLDNKPIKGDNMWIDNSGRYLNIVGPCFPQVKWEDEEPTKVELTIKICE